MKNIVFISIFLGCGICRAGQEPLPIPRIAKEQPRPTAYTKYTPEQQAARVAPMVIIPRKIEPNNRSIDENDWYVPVVRPEAGAKAVYTRPPMTR